MITKGEAIKKLGEVIFSSDKGHNASKLIEVQEYIACTGEVENLPKVDKSDLIEKLATLRISIRNSYDRKSLNETMDSLKDLILSLENEK